ncbi:zinc ribbon domain-containing protein [Streptomyces sp. NPDC005892]|uniref:NADase-type glycan-binding domain-containing protein n=1 Tax=Streptomyces sp. NPDC005892 TaxID=3155593 RepID=UPI0033DF46C6
MTTQNCAECGTRAEPGLSFCDACGAVLSWADRPATPAGAASGARAHGGAAGAGAGSGAGEASEAASAPWPSPSSSPSSPTSSSSSSPAPSSVAPSAGSGDAGPGWDAFARPGGGVGLPRQSREPRGNAREPLGAEPGAPDGSPYANPADRAGGAPGASAYDDPFAAAPVEHARPAGHGTYDGHDSRHEADTQEVPGAADGWADGGAAAEAHRAAEGGADRGADDGGMADRARRLIVPVSDPGPVATPSVAPVLPGRPVPQRPHSVQAPGEELGVHGGTPCPWCSTRNRPDRHYCTRCAMPMAGDRQETGRRLPWWRRLLDTRTRETPWAGDRPRVRRTFDRVLSWVGAAIVVTLVIVAVVHIPDAVQATRDHFSKRAPVSPDHVSASRSYQGHKPDSSFDKLNNTWWGPGVSESGKGQWIEASFDSPTRLLNVIVMPGVSPRADKNTEQALPHRMDVTVTQSSGKVTHREITLDDGAGGQTRNFRFDDVTKVRFTVVSAYHASASKQVALAEIEFFGPSHAGDN